MDGNKQQISGLTHKHKLIKKVIIQKQSCASNLHYTHVFVHI